MKREKELTQLRAVHSPLLARQPARTWMTGCAPDEEEQSSRVGSSLPQPRACGRACVKWQTLAADDSRSPRQLALASRVKHVRQGSRSSAPLRSRRLVWTALDPAARPKRFESDDFLPRKMRPNGLEPSRGNLPTRPSTLRVYQFRHGRRGASIAPGSTRLRCLGAGAACIRPGPALQCEHMFVTGRRPPEPGVPQQWI